MFGCKNDEKSTIIYKNYDSNVVIGAVGKENIYTQDTSLKKMSKRKITITVSYAAISCSCPQWFETKYKDVKYLDGVERFYLEPLDTTLLNSNNLWDGEHLPLTVKVTGEFTNEQFPPNVFGNKGKMEKARVFWYDKISIVSPTDK